MRTCNRWPDRTSHSSCCTNLQHAFWQTLSTFVEHHADDDHHYGVYLLKCVTGVFIVALPSGQRSAKVKSERVQCGFPSCGPSYLAFACGVEWAHGRVEAFACCLLAHGNARAPGWSGGTGRSDTRIAFVEQTALRIHAVVQERDEALPRDEPQTANGGIFALPVFEHLVARDLRGRRGAGRADRFHVAPRRVAVLLRRVLERDRASDGSRTSARPPAARPFPPRQAGP